MSVDYLKLYIHFGGEVVVRDGSFSYCGNSMEDTALIDPDLMTWSIFDDFCKRNKVSGLVEQVWYKLPHEDIAAARYIGEDRDGGIRKLCAEAVIGGEVDIYLQQGLCEPEPLPLSNPGEYDIADESEESEAEEDNNDQNNADDVGEDPVEEEATNADPRFDAFLNEINNNTADEVPQEGNGNNGEGQRDELDDETEEYEAEFERQCRDADRPDHLLDTDDEWENYNVKEREVSRKKYSKEKPPYLWLLQRFDSGEEFKDQLLRYVLKTNYDVKLCRWSQFNLAAVCRHEKCKWKIYCSLQKRSGKWMVMSYEDALAAEDLLKTDPWTWCRAFFQTHSSCEDVSNNLSESFNRTIKEARRLPVLSMLEDVRRLCMKRISRRSEKIKNYHSKFPPHIMDILEANRKSSKFCSVLKSGENLYEVQEGSQAFCVNLRLSHCACNQWNLTGIPCPHAIHVLTEVNRNAEDYVDKHFLTSLWKENYKNNIQPVNGDRLWVKTGKGQIEVPDKRKKRGRPKKYARFTEPTQSSSNPTKATRDGMTVTCLNCKNTGHNKSTCKSQPVEPAPKRKRGRPRKHLAEDDPWSVDNAPKRWRAAQTQATPAASQSQNTEIPQHSSAPAGNPSGQGKSRGRPKGVKNGEGKGKAKSKAKDKAKDKGA